jgi:uncharacterized protein YndB with AHSA1/START domain
MPNPAPAVLEDEQGRAVLRFERELPHPPERVWEAITATEQLRSWHPTPFEFEPRNGGAVRYRADLGGPEMPPGTVLEYEPPRAFAYSWGEDGLRFELLPRPDGCLLILTHTFEDRLKAARDAAGWHMCLDALAGSLAGRPGTAPADGPRIPEGWAALNAEYERRFGIAHEQATRPPTA